jgi:chromosome partitioning protein
MSIIMMINLKGGVAKTTNAVAISECLASSGKRTLLIDADHQCMAGELLLGEQKLHRCEGRGETLHDLLAAMCEDEFKADQIEPHVKYGCSNIGGGLDNLAVLPCSVRIDDFTTNMAKARRGYNTNEDFLNVWRRRRVQIRRWANSQFEHTIIDCPPSLALQVKFLLGVAEYFIVPTIPDRLSLRGSVYLVERIRKGGFKIPALGTLWSMYRTQVATHHKMRELVESQQPPYGVLPRPFDTVIPHASKITEASDVGEAHPPSFRRKYTPEFARLYEALCQEIELRVCQAQG